MLNLFIPFFFFLNLHYINYLSPIPHFFIFFFISILKGGPATTLLILLFIFSSSLNYDVTQSRIPHIAGPHIS
jgi:hypothetical protein